MSAVLETQLPVERFSSKISTRSVRCSPYRADNPEFAQNKIATDPSNVFLHPFPPPRPASLDSLLNKLALLEYSCGIGLFIVWLSVAFGSGIVKFMWRSTLCALIGAGLMTGMSLVSRGLEKEVERASLFLTCKSTY